MTEGGSDKHVKTVFLSSLSTDLTSCRDEVYKAIEGLDGYHCVRMENFGARYLASLDVCAAKVAECDIFVAILGHQYGSSPVGSSASYSELEYDAAQCAGKPCLVFCAREDFLPVPANLIKYDHRSDLQREFRARVKRNHAITYFKREEELALLVSQAIHNFTSEASKPPTDARAEEQQTAGQRGPSPQPITVHTGGVASINQQGGITARDVHVFVNDPAAPAHLKAFRTVVSEGPPSTKTEFKIFTNRTIDKPNLAFVFDGEVDVVAFSSPRVRFALLEGRLSTSDGQADRKTFWVAWEGPSFTAETPISFTVSSGAPVKLIRLGKGPQRPS